jgi:hypothetical protein
MSYGCGRKLHQRWLQTEHLDRLFRSSSCKPSCARGGSSSFLEPSCEACVAHWSKEHSLSCIPEESACPISSHKVVGVVFDSAKRWVEMLYDCEVGLKDVESAH